MSFFLNLWNGNFLNCQSFEVGLVKIPWFGQSLYSLVRIQKFPELIQGNEGQKPFTYAEKDLSFCDFKVIDKP